MPLSMFKANWNMNMIDGGLNQMLGSCDELSGHELVDAFLQVSAGRAIVGTHQITFQIGDDDMHVWHSFVVFLRWRDPHLLMVVFGQCFERGGDVALNCVIRRNPFSEPSHAVLIGPDQVLKRIFSRTLNLSCFLH